MREYGKFPTFFQPVPLGKGGAGGPCPGRLAPASACCPLPGRPQHDATEHVLSSRHIRYNWLSRGVRARVSNTSKNGLLGRGGKLTPVLKHPRTWGTETETSDVPVLLKFQGGAQLGESCLKRLLLGAKMTKKKKKKKKS